MCALDNVGEPARQASLRNRPLAGVVMKDKQSGLLWSFAKQLEQGCQIKVATIVIQSWKIRDYYYWSADY